MQGLTLEHMGWVQVVMLLLLGANYSIVSMNHALPTFHGYTPPFHCKTENETKCETSNNTSIEGSTCPEGYQFNSPSGEYTIVSEWQLVCDRRLLLPLTATLYFSGVTGGAILCGMLADRFGRRPIMLICLFVQAFLGVVIYFINTLEAFMALRAVQGFFVQGLQGSTYTLLMEVFPSHIRTAVGILLELYWAFGLAALSGFAYLLPHWRLLQLTLAAPAAVTLLYMFAIPESPRWLTTRGRHEEAHKVWNNLYPHAVPSSDNQLKSTSSQEKLAVSASILTDKTMSNDTALTINDLELLKKTEERQPNENIMETHQEIEKGSEQIETAFSTYDSIVEEIEQDIEKITVMEENEIRTDPMNTEAEPINEKTVTVKKKEEKSHFFELLTRSVIRKHSFVMTYIWFCVSLSYYGILFYLPALSGERHLNFFLGSLLEVPAYLIGFGLLSRYGRRIPLCGYLLYSGIICVVVGAISEVPDGTTSWNDDLRTALTLLGKMGVVSSFCSIYLYTSELFPTVLRAAAMGLCGFCGRVGSLIAPQLLLLGEYTHTSVPMVCMGTLCLVAGVAALALPETLDQTLPDTIEQVQLLADKRTVQKKQP